MIETPNDRFGIIASGKAYNDTRQALLDLGLDDDTCRRLGIRLHKVGVVWPLEAQGTREFAQGLREILVVEEKRQVIEYQLKEELYNWRPDVRPNVLGKFDEVEGDYSGGEWSMPNPTANTLLRANADLSPALIARAIARRLKKLGLDGDVQARIDAQLAILDAKERAMQVVEVKGDRMPWFCSGCPHNTSTVVPEGSRAMAGIGCHFMATWMDRATIGFTQMGGEGVPWVGQQPFTTDKHMFANLGDGTYFHSGLLAIRQAIAAGVNITYKVLYNDAVAMTGGQPVGERPEGHSPLQIAHSLMAEGVAKLVVVTDEPEKYEGAKLPAGVTVHHRDELDRIQRELREIPGVTAIIYDQTCATEKRRRRKRGTMVDPARARDDQRPGLRGLRRLQRQVQLPVGGAAGDRVRPQAHASTRAPATRTPAASRASARASSPSKAGKLKKAKAAQGARRPSSWARAARAACCRRPPRPRASWWPASAAPASSPSASCWAWPRTSKARASSRRTPPAWRRRAAPPGATC